MYHHSGREFKDRFVLTFVLQRSLCFRPKGVEWIGVFTENYYDPCEPVFNKVPGIRSDNNDRIFNAAFK